MLSEKLIKDITKECEIIYNDYLKSFVISYKGIPLFLTIYENFTQSMRVDVMAQCEDGIEMEYYILATTPIIGCKGEFDYNIYGQWFDKERLEQWLQSPVIVY